MGLISDITAADIRVALIIAAGVLELAAIIAGVVDHETTSPRITRRAQRALFPCLFSAAAVSALPLVLRSGDSLLVGIVLFVVYAVLLAIPAMMLPLIAVPIFSPAARRHWRAAALEERRARARTWAEDHGIEIRSTDDLDRIIAHDTDFARERCVPDHDWSSISSGSFDSGFSSSIDIPDGAINPASGLPMCGSLDIAGNAYGCGCSTSIGGIGGIGSDW